jgi:hypothetical protein
MINRFTTGRLPFGAQEVRQFPGCPVNRLRPWNLEVSPPAVLDECVGDDASSENPKDRHLRLPELI